MCSLTDTMPHVFLCWFVLPSLSLALWKQANLFSLQFVLSASSETPWCPCFHMHDAHTHLHAGVCVHHACGNMDTMGSHLKLTVQIEEKIGLPVSTKPN